jgi:hypothetical protein
VKLLQGVGGWQQGRQQFAGVREISRGGRTGQRLRSQQLAAACSVERCNQAAELTWKTPWLRQVPCPCSSGTTRSPGRMRVTCGRAGACNDGEVLWL